MSEEEIKENLCAYDKRNPDCSLDDDEDIKDLRGKGRCYCDNCFYGLTDLAEELLKVTNQLKQKI